MEKTAPHNGRKLIQINMEMLCPKRRREFFFSLSLSSIIYCSSQTCVERERERETWSSCAPITCLLLKKSHSQHLPTQDPKRALDPRLWPSFRPPFDSLPLMLHPHQVTPTLDPSNPHKPGSKVAKWSQDLCTMSECVNVYNSKLPNTT